MENSQSRGETSPSETRHKPAAAITTFTASAIAVADMVGIGVFTSLDDFILDVVIDE